MKSTSGGPVAFGAAGHRHLQDGRHLLDHGRHVTADHLAGLAVECLLKAVLVEFLGAGMNKKGVPELTNGSEARHLPKLWGQVGAHISGRNGPQFIALLAAPNPFRQWQVHDRYSDGTAVAAPVSRAHLDAASSIAAIHEQAHLDGAVP